MNMNYYAFYSLGKYDPNQFGVFESLDKVLEFLDTQATNTEFYFRVVRGEEVFFEPAVTVKSYKVKK
jgi:nicotinamide riboside kinase